VSQRSCCAYVEGFGVNAWLPWRSSEPTILLVVILDLARGVHEPWRCCRQYQIHSLPSTPRFRSRLFLLDARIDLSRKLTIAMEAISAEALLTPRRIMRLYQCCRGSRSTWLLCSWPSPTLMLIETRDSSLESTASSPGSYRKFRRSRCSLTNPYDFDN
jgi:hypothetical protein